GERVARAEPVDDVDWNTRDVGALAVLEQGRSVAAPLHDHRLGPELEQRVEAAGSGDLVLVAHDDVRARRRFVRPGPILTRLVPERRPPVEIEDRCAAVRT